MSRVNIPWRFHHKKTLNLAASLLLTLRTKQTIYARSKKVEGRYSHREWL